MLNEHLFIWMQFLCTDNDVVGTVYACMWLRVAACGCVWLRIAACGCV